MVLFLVILAVLALAVMAVRPWTARALRWWALGLALLALVLFLFDLRVELR